MKEKLSPYEKMKAKLEKARLRKKLRPPKPPKPRVKKAKTWLTTWRRLLPDTTFDTIDELGQFLHDQGLHTGDIPSAEAFRLGYAKTKDSKFYWHLARCMCLLRLHGFALSREDYEP